MFLIIMSKISKDTKEDVQTGYDNEFPCVGGFPSRFDNFNIFKKLVYKFAEKDEEIRNYLLSRKNRINTGNADIPDSDVDGKTDG